MLRREFLLKTLRLGGLVGLCQFLPYKEAVAFSGLPGGGVASAAGGCATQQDYNWSTTSAGSDFFGLTDYVYIGSKFTAGASYTPCEIDIRIKAAAGKTPTFLTYVGIWSHNSGSDEPDSLLGSETDSFDTDGIGETYITQTMSWSSGAPPLTADTVYWEICRASFSSVQYCQLEISQSPDTGVTRIARSNDGSTWTIESTNESNRFEIRSA